MSIWKNLQFTRFFVSLTIGNIGDWFDIFAIQIIFVHEWHVSPIMLSVLILFYFLPAIVLSPMAGVMAERISKRNLMIVTDLAAAVLTAGLYLSGSETTALSLLLIRACVVSFNAPTQQAYIKYVVTDQQLLAASSYTTIALQMCKGLGPMLGAAVLLYASPRACLAINALSFVLSAVILIGLPSDKAEKKKPGEAGHEPWMQAMRTGANYVWHNNLMRITLSLVMVWFFCSLVRQAQLAIFLKHVLPHKPNALGIFMGLDGLGAVITGSLLSKRKALTHHGGYLFFGFLAIASGTLALGLYQTTWPHAFLYACALLIGCGTGILLVNYSYIIKKGTSKEYMGRVAGITSALQNAALTLGTISSGFLVIHFGIQEVYQGIAVVLMLLAVSALLWIKKPGVCAQRTL